MLVAGNVSPAYSFDLAALLSSPSAQSSTRVVQQASISRDAAQEHLDAGSDALQHRLFDMARIQLTEALIDLQRRHAQKQLIAEAKEELAEAYLGLDRYEHALSVFNEAFNDASEVKDEQLECAALTGAAEANYKMHQLKRAQALCERVIALCQHLEPTAAIQQARVETVLGDMAADQRLDSTAIADYRQALKLYDAVSHDNYEAALSQQKLARLLRGQDPEEAQSLFRASFATIDKQCRFNTPINLAPRVVMRWDSGNPHSRVIADPIYPLKYILINGLRIAATPVRSENVIAVIVSLANCSSNRLQLAIGPVGLQQLAPKQRNFTYVSNGSLDIPLEERHATDLTWRRAWLNHIEKTRVIPGYLKNNCLDVDNFFGNNQFGEYGDWQTIACSETPIVTREQFYYSPQRPHDVATENFLSEAAGAYKHTYLDPGEARTGLVFFQRERYDKLQVTVNIGNTIVEIPFDDTSQLQGY
jgi:tetratricopeptide (TPR) repeat protein